MKKVRNTLLFSTRRGLIVYNRKNGQWAFESEHFLGIPISYSFEDERNGKWWACQDHGHWGCKLSFSDDRGKSWTEVEAPAYPEGEEIADGKPASTRYLWVMAAGLPSQPGRLYVGTEPGGLFQSDDDGKTFQLVEALWNDPTRKTQWFGGGRTYPGIHSILCNPEDENHVVIGISCAGVYETKDGGKSWQVKNKGLIADFLPDPDSEVGQDPHFVSTHPGNFQVMWQQNHCGIFRTADGAQTWHNVSENEGHAFFGFVVTADEEDVNTAWVVPAISDQMRVTIDRALCVCRTNDGGKTWQRLSKGLPQEHCYDLVYRHGMDISGNTLAFGTTTGNIYFSDDKGDSWNTLSNHLSDVYALRFAE